MTLPYKEDNVSGDVDEVCYTQTDDVDASGTAHARMQEDNKGEEGGGQCNAVNHALDLQKELK